MRCSFCVNDDAIIDNCIGFEGCRKINETLKCNSTLTLLNLESEERNDNPSHKQCEHDKHE